MKLREILELTKSVKLAIIAKEQLDFGEKKAVEALKLAGCYFISGKPGWHFDGDESILEKSIYDFVPSTKRKAKATTGVNAGNYTGIKTGAGTTSSASTNKGTGVGIKTGDSAGKKTAFKEVATGIDTGDNIGMKTSTTTSTSTDILDRLFTGLPATSDKKEVSFYLTHDVIEVINRAKKGNRSDLVNEALRKVFREKGWL